MSDAPAMLGQVTRDAAELRAMYERYVFLIVPAVVVLVILVAVAAVLWPTPYGQTAINRLLQIAATVMELIGILLGGTGLTMTRGHLDQKLQQGDK